MTDRPPPLLVSAAQAVLRALEAAHVPACLIGGMAIPRWGQPRATTDADVSVLAPYGEEERVLDILLAHFRARTPDARAFALDRRVLLLETADGVKIDVDRIRRWSREFAELKEDPELLRPFEDALRKAQVT